MNQCVLVLDFGGQYKELIARAVRGLSVYSEIHPGQIKAEDVKALNPIGIIFTGGPNSAYNPDSPHCDPAIFELGIPILGICYGMQMLCHMLGGNVAPCEQGEYGIVSATLKQNGALFTQLASTSNVLMSHSDRVFQLPEGFVNTAHTDRCEHAGCENIQKKIFGVQFHPEVEHSQQGRAMLKAFLYDICNAKGDYHLDDYIDRQVRIIREVVGDERVLLALSGGVDSSVCAALLSKAIPDRLTCIFVDHGFMRLNEGDEIERIFSKRALHFIRVNAQDRFLHKIKGITEPEKKRKHIGNEFIYVFQDQAKQLGQIPFLAQGTIYPDVIESGGTLGATIKSHHNVGGLPEQLGFTKVIEPLAGLFKDEVRELGKKLGLPLALINRQPFPGPGLAIRVMGEVTEEKLQTVRQADAIFCHEISRLRKKPQQYFAVLTDTRSVGVKGDYRTYDHVIALRAVTTSDFMTCQYTPLNHNVLNRASSRITSEVQNVSRVVYDISSKPPATVEWE